MQKYRVRRKALIHKYGKAVLHSEEFRKARTQKHHEHTTVANHTLYVTDTAIRINNALKKLHLVKTDEKVLVIAALCHDLGIIGRDRKYQSDSECYQCHAADSVRVAQRLYPDIDAKTLDAIRCHMYPLTKTPPKSAEGYILIAADKFCSVSERLYLEINKGKRFTSSRA